jgi:5-methylcytosine-specific restriction endonuclease McrA
VKGKSFALLGVVAQSSLRAADFIKLTTAALNIRKERRKKTRRVAPGKKRRRAERKMIDGKVLVLNRLWQAVNVCSMKRAISLLYQNHAYVVTNEDETLNTFNFENWKKLSSDSNNGEIIRTVSFTMKLPSIILLLFYDQLPMKEIKFSRKNIFERDKNRCQYCGRKFEAKELNIDHVIPKAAGGLTIWENVVCCCSACNHRKSNRRLEEIGMQLVKRPKRPRWHPLITMNYQRSQHPAWSNFLKITYEENERV